MTRLALILSLGLIVIGCDRPMHEAISEGTEPYQIKAGEDLGIRLGMSLALSSVDEPRKSAVIAICASILASRKLATAPRNSPLYVAAIADAVADAKRIVERIERDDPPKKNW
jgi:hypothetical protein